MENNSNGKKPIKIVNENNNLAKKPIKIINSNSEVKNKKISIFNYLKNKKILLSVVAFVCIIVLLFLLNTAPVDIEKIKDSVVLIKTYDINGNELSTGSGFCTYEKNYIVTNFHVINGAYKIEIVTDENKTYKINNILIFNENDDLAIISGNFELTPLKIGNISNLKAGEEITAIGSPKGQLNTVSTGVISNADNDYDIRITAPISPGSSGGALLNKNGKIIGITFATYNSYDSQNINYAISVKYLNKMYNALKDNDITTINKTNYLNFMGSLNDLENYNFSKSKYYKVSDLDTLYKLTNINNRFEYLLEKEDYSWYEIYNSLNSNDKDDIINLYNELLLYEFTDSNIAYNIKKWDVTDFFMNLNILNKYEYAIVSVDIQNYNNKNDIFNHVNEQYPLDAAEKSLILYLIGNHQWSDIHKDNKEDIFDYFDKKYGTQDLGAILEMLGYDVVYEEDGTLTGYW